MLPSYLLKSTFKSENIRKQCLLRSRRRLTTKTKCENRPCHPPKVASLDTKPSGPISKITIGNNHREPQDHLYFLRAQETSYLYPYLDKIPNSIQGHESQGCRSNTVLSLRSWVCCQSGQEFTHLIPATRALEWILSAIYQRTEH